jgi:hypothetical protein
MQPMATGLGALTGAGIGAMQSSGHVLPGAGYGALAGTGLGLAVGPIARSIMRRSRASAPMTAGEDEILKQAFGQAMFKAAPAPDPKVQATGAKPPTASGPKAPSGPTGSTGGGGTGAPAVQSVPSPSVSGGPASAGAGVGMG